MNALLEQIRWTGLAGERHRCTGCGDRHDIELLDTLHTFENGEWAGGDDEALLCERCHDGQGPAAWSPANAATRRPLGLVAWLAVTALYADLLGLGWLGETRLALREGIASAAPQLTMLTATLASEALLAYAIVAAWRAVGTMPHRLAVKPWMALGVAVIGLKVGRLYAPLDLAPQATSTFIVATVAAGFALALWRRKR